MRHFLILLLATALLGSCSKHEIDPNAPQDIETLSKAPESLRIGGNRLQLECFLWRDFMPVLPDSGGSGLYSRIRLFDERQAALPADLELRFVYIIKGDDFVRGSLTEVGFMQDFAQEGMFRNGPRWGPDEVVDVVVEFSVGDKTYRIQAKEQPIGATY